MIDPREPDFTLTPAAPGRPQPGYAPADPEAPPAVSIVTPYFNTGPVFHETARTVFGQTLQQFEWLIVNDGSTDPEALAVLDAYRARDPRVRVIDHPRNRGLPGARNTGFAAARAPLVLQLDSDDLLEPTAAEVWAWYLESHPEAAFVKGYSVGFGAQRYLWSEGFGTPEAFLRRNNVDATSLVRASAHRAAGGYDEAMRGGLEDWDFWLRCADAGVWGATIPLYLSWYRRRDNHADRWSGLERRGRERFLAAARARYPRLWAGGMPRVAPRPQAPLEAPAAGPPFENLLAAGPRRALVLAESLGPAGREVLEAARRLAEEGFGVTVAATDSADTALLPALARVTADVFVLPLFLRPADIPRFLAYLARSRRVERVVATGPGAGAVLLPALRPGAALPHDLAVHLAAAAAERARLALEHERLLRSLAPRPLRDTPAVAALRRAYYWGRERGLGPLTPLRDAFVRIIRRADR